MGHLFDLAALAGVLLVGAGLWLIHPSLALLWVGAALLFVGIFGAMLFGKERQSQ